MNTTAISLLKLAIEKPTKAEELQKKLKIGNWQLSSYIRSLKQRGYLAKKGSVISIQDSPKIQQLIELSEQKIDIENILRESNEDILSYLTEPITIGRLIFRTNLSRATIYRAISDFEKIDGFVKQGDLVSIDPLSSLFFFVKLLHHDRMIKEKIDEKKEIKNETKSEKLSFEALKTHVWAAADVLRGALDANEYRQPIMTLLYLKRLNDKFDAEKEKYIKEKKDQAFLDDPDNYEDLFIPDGARWEDITGEFENIGEKIDDVCSAIEHVDSENLEGVLTSTTYNDKKRYPDDVLLELVAHFNKKRLRNEDLENENEDIFGQAYEYLLEQFADTAGKKAGEFFTPREVVELLVELTQPKAGMRICDPTVGSGGMLIWSHKYVREHGENANDLALHGQERNLGNYGMCKMNMLLHNIRKSRIEHENVLKNPLLIKNGKLIKYDLVLANFPFSMDWDSSNAANDPYGRFEFGIPPSKGKADFAFIQHMLASLNDTGKAAIICSPGILFRGGEEGKIRKALINLDENETKNNKSDFIEGIISLPSNLFFGTGIPACILFLNKNKPKERKNKIIFIYATKDYEDLKKRDILRPQDIQKIVSAFNNFKEIEGYCHIADLKEIEEQEYNLNVPRYIDISEPDEEIDVQQVFKKLKLFEEQANEIESAVQSDLKQLGYGTK